MRVKTPSGRRCAAREGRSSYPRRKLFFEGLSAQRVHEYLGKELPTQRLFRASCTQSFGPHSLRSKEQSCTFSPSQTKLLSQSEREDQGGLGL